MNDVLDAIIEVERECAQEIAAKKDDHDAALNSAIDRLEAGRTEEKKRITDANAARYRAAVEAAEREIGRELSDAKSALDGLRDDTALCKEVRERIITIIFSS